MKIFVVREFDYDHNDIIGVAETEALAQKYVDIVSRKPENSDYEYQIEELDSDSIDEELIKELSKDIQYAVVFWLEDKSGRLVKREDELIIVSPEKNLDVSDLVKEAEYFDSTVNCFKITVPVEVDETNQYDLPAALKMVDELRVKYIKYKYNID